VADNSAAADHCPAGAEAARLQVLQGPGAEYAHKRPCDAQPWPQGTQVERREQLLASGCNVLSSSLSSSFFPSPVRSGAVLSCAVAAILLD
jgi:hypothetical protein